MPGDHVVGAKATAVPRLWGKMTVASLKDIKGRHEAHLYVMTDEVEAKRGGMLGF